MRHFGNWNNTSQFRIQRGKINGTRHRRRHTCNKTMNLKKRFRQLCKLPFNKVNVSRLRHARHVDIGRRALDPQRLEV
jgi:hypothetical protein